MKNKVYFFDMDGTLIDSMQIAWEEVILKYLDDRGIHYHSGIISKIVTKGFMGISKYYVEELGVKSTPEKLYDYFMEALEIKYQKEFPLKEGVKDFIKSLKEKGHSVNVISGSPLGFVEPCLKRLEVYDLFDNVFSIEAFGLTKSDKELFIKLAETMQASPKDCVVIDDSVNAIKTAKSAGLTTIGVYEKMVKEDWQEMRSVADQTVLNFTELI